MSAHRHGVTRRTVLAWAVASLVLPKLPEPPQGSGRVPDAVGVRPVVADDGPQDPPPRFRFDCVSPVPLFAPLTRVEEVWASPRYLTFTGCVVRYVGEGPFVLTPQEDEIVEVGAAAGGVVEDRTDTYLRVLRVSTRVDPARFAQKLAEFGAPVVVGALTFAPAAPHAELMARWLASTGTVVPGAHG